MTSESQITELKQPVETIDSVEFQRLIETWWHADTTISVATARQALIAYIDARLPNWQTGIRIHGLSSRACFGCRATLYGDEMSNVIEGMFNKPTPKQEELVDELYALLNKYSNHCTLAVMVGLLEMVKADVLDSMITRD